MTDRVYYQRHFYRNDTDRETAGASVTVFGENVKEELATELLKRFEDSGRGKPLPPLRAALTTYDDKVVYEIEKRWSDIVVLVDEIG